MEENKNILSHRLHAVNERGERQTIKVAYSLWTYDVWGNARDGFTVNDRSCVNRRVELTHRLTLHNVPIAPGVADAHRAVACQLSLTGTVMLSWEVDDKEVAALFGTTPEKIETEGDDRVIYVNSATNGKPLGELQLIGVVHPHIDTETTNCNVIPFVDQGDGVEPINAFKTKDCDRLVTH